MDSGVAPVSSGGLLINFSSNDFACAALPWLIIVVAETMGKSGSRGNAREREILRKPSAQALTWVEAHRRWVAGHPKFSQGHIANSKITLKQWYASFGSNSTIEDATIHFYNNRKVS